MFPLNPGLKDKDHVEITEKVIDFLKDGVSSEEFTLWLSVAPDVDIETIFAPRKSMFDHRMGRLCFRI